MSENSKIQWTDDTYNPWRGCTKVSEGCKNCYAEKLITNRLAHLHYEAATSGSDKRTSKHFHQTAGGHSTSGIQFWGKGSPRIRAVDLNEPLRWNKKPWVCENGHANATENCGIVMSNGCGTCGARVHRRRVFSLSLGDWLDDEVPIAWLADFLDVVRRCENLDWLLVTKRPELWASRIEAVLKWLEANDCKWPADRTSSLPLRNYLADWFVLRKSPQNVMILTSVENQKAADERIPALLNIPATRRGLSCEPLIGMLNIKDALRCDVSIHWVIAGCESGPGRRELDGYTNRVRMLRDHCRVTGVPFFHKQMPIGQRVSGDITEWPTDLQVREFYK